MIQGTVKSRGQKIAWSGFYVVQEAPCLLGRQKIQAVTLP